jgi:6-phosphofructokinase 1
VINGFEGLINGEFRSLGARDVGGILQRGGTILLTSRSKRFMEPGGQREAVRKMNEAGVDALVTIGGEGTLKGAQALSKQGRVVEYEACVAISWCNISSGQREHDHGSCG